MARPDVKICGLADTTSIDAALTGGAAFIGFIFYPPSPRAVDPERAKVLIDHIAGRARAVGVFVDPEDSLLETAVNAGIDLIQLHGSEGPDRVEAVRSQFGLPVIKALKIGVRDDLKGAGVFDGVADYLLLDARPPKDSPLPGGNGTAFDWSLLDGFAPTAPWFLSGGLAADTVGPALARTDATLLDVSSGVEKAPGVKDPALISAFLAAARTAGQKPEKDRHHG